MEILTHTSARTGVVAYHEYRGVMMLPQNGKVRVTRHYWHGVYRPQLFASIKEAVAYIDSFLDSDAYDMNHYSCDGFLCIDRKRVNND